MARIQLCILRWVGLWAVETWKYPALGQHQAAFQNNSMPFCDFNHSHFAQITSISVFNWYFPSRQHLLQAGVSNHQQCQLKLHLGSMARDFSLSSILLCSSSAEIQGLQCDCTWVIPMISQDLHRVVVVVWILITDAQRRTKSKYPL